MQRPTVVVGIPWHRRETFGQVRALMRDADLMPATYEKFLYAAQKVEEQARRAGRAVVRVHLDVDEFTAFCRARGLDLDAKGRVAYANARAAVIAQDDPRGQA